MLQSYTGNCSATNLENMTLSDQINLTRMQKHCTKAMIMKSSIVILVTYLIIPDVIRCPVPPLQSQRTNNIEWYEKSTPLIEEPLKL